MAKKIGSKSKGPKTRSRVGEATLVRCTLESPGREPVVLEAEHAEFARLAMKWNYLVRNRYRWTGSDELVEELGESVKEDLRLLSPGTDFTNAFRGARIIQVTIPYVKEEHSWPARIFPWEFVISRVTKPWRSSRSRFIVVRHLECDDHERKRTASDDLLFVESSPGRFADDFVFDDEFKLLECRARRARRAGKSTCTRLIDPSLAQLRDAAGRFGAVHFSGIDAHKGRELLECTGPSEEKDDASDIDDSGDSEESSTKLNAPFDGDGLYLAMDSGPESDDEHCIDPEGLALAINEAGSPDVVTFNVHHSAARLAALAVAEGAGAAVGFQDDFDDALTEHFYAVFYERWFSSRSVLDAFWSAYDSLKSMPRLERGSGIVLWSGTSLLDDAAAATRARAPKRPVSRPIDARESVAIRIEVPDSLNYSRLHNGENVFDRFRFYNFSTQAIRDIRISVELQVGAESYTYRHSLDLEAPTLSIEDDIHMALSWSLAKSLQESVRTTLHARVECQGLLLFQRTYALDLLPVDEWIDDDRSGPWLPSFVLPRDPVIAAVVDRARRYLRVLADDAAAGFDGYQQVRTSDDVEAAMAPVSAETSEIIDRQVRAVWFALLHDYGLGYVNPPPTYTVSSQRLRRPSDVIDSKQGTCIDLALLFASCLEYLGINAVIILIQGHAFPGYWREQRTLETVSTMVEVPGRRSSRVTTMSSLSERRPWRCGKEAYRVIRHLARIGQLVPIETVSLTALESFGVAVAKGLENLRSESQFHSVLDVTAAREHGVTPLPL